VAPVLVSCVVLPRLVCTPRRKAGTAAVGAEVPALRLGDGLRCQVAVACLSSSVGVSIVATTCMAMARQVRAGPEMVRGMVVGSPVRARLSCEAAVAAVSHMPLRPQRMKVSFAIVSSVLPRQVCVPRGGAGAAAEVGVMPVQPLKVGLRGRAAPATVSRLPCMQSGA